jgi:hypothetical protein
MDFHKDSHPPSTTQTMQNPFSALLSWVIAAKDIRWKLYFSGKEFVFYESGGL